MSKNIKATFNAIGLMSGTSMDGIDLALIESDGHSYIKRKNFAYFPYDAHIKRALQHLIFGAPNLLEIKIAENEFTLLNAQAVNRFLQENKMTASDVDLIAFHGHTILHNPNFRATWQIGNAQLLEASTAINVISDFRNHDVALGGHGAPLVPIYHFHLLHNQPMPVMALNIGGISNVTYFYNNNENDIEAFDVCFGNAPFDDLLRQKLNLDFDKDGELTKSGTINFDFANKVLQNKIFYLKPPKSFDRNDFAALLIGIENLKLEDALATLAYILAKALQINYEMLAQIGGKPKSILVCGGGRHNHAIMDEMRKAIPSAQIKAIDELGFNGDAIEAEAFAFLGIRRILGLPISFQKTTGRN